ncbi:MAG: HlyD family secretion protein [Cypionkella sp.]
MIAVAAVLAAIAAIGWYVWGQNTGGLPDGLATGNGRIETDQVDIATKIPGRIAEIRVNEGALVQPGDVLAVMDTAGLQAKLAWAKADAASASSKVEEVRALIEKRRAERTFAEEEYGRATQLAERGVNSRSATDQQKARLATAELF